MSLGTTDRLEAEVMTAILRYEADADAQNGNHEVVVVPDNIPALQGPTPQPVAQVHAQPPTVTPNGVPIYKSLGVVQRAFEATRRRAKPEAVGVSLCTLADDWIANISVAPSTKPKQASRLKTCERHLDFGLDVAHIGTEELNRALNELRKKCKESYVHDLWKKCLLTILQLAVDQELIEHVPKVKLLRKATVERLQPEWDEAIAILERMDIRTPKSAELCRAMLFIGIGPAEIKGLRGEHFDLKRGQITCFRVKTRKHYYPPIYPHAQEFVNRLNKRGRLKQGKTVFAWRNPEKAFKTACHALGHPAYELRALRRCLIVHLLEQGTDPRMVAEWQGHADTRLIFSTYGRYIGKDYKDSQLKKLSA